MIFLIDHNIEGQALVLFGSITTGGWLDLLPIRFATFEEVQLPINSNDRMVWRFARAESNDSKDEKQWKSSKELSNRKLIYRSSISTQRLGESLVISV